jgi:uncharacterized membrane protein
MTGLQEEAKPATDWGKQPQSERSVRLDLTGPFDDVSLEDPKTYRAFVRSLMGRIEARLATKLDDDVQAELASLTRLLASMPPKAVAANRVYFELAFDLLAAEQPNLLLARSIRWQLAAIVDRTSYGITRFIGYICGGTAMNAVLSALLSTFILAFFLLWLMMTGHRALVQNISGTYDLFEAIDERSVALLIIAIHAAFIGGVFSILARIQDFLSDPTLSPPLVYVSVIRKPFLSATVVVLVFSVLRAGMISFNGVDLAGPSAPYLAWAIGFLCGFSERFAQDFVVSASGRFGEPGAPALKPSQPSQPSQNRN